MWGKTKWVVWKNAVLPFAVTVSLILGHIVLRMWESVCVGLSAMRDLAADVTFLPVNFNESITHHYGRHTPVLQEMCVSSLHFFCFPLKAQRSMSDTQVLPEWNFLSTFKWISKGHADSDEKRMLFQIMI